MADLTIVEKKIHKHRLNLCKEFPEMVTCPVVKDHHYERNFDIDFIGNFDRDDHSLILPIKIHIDIFGEHGQLACAILNLNITKSE
ncbi:hypothetical protein BLA29_008150 [Euroglyphus maynei]|uniref:MD-2-related lipid-recognition domain-containing protein n=1 Tax=Euroglyphus maynei TaxID=6958 RepID=A0A1Y3AUA1_EURMA|nr:hypothetical protein BLA29_008150 [Euroglyphus maynei]